MAQRHSGYARIESEHYATPRWVVDELLKVESFKGPVWEICPGELHMVQALQENGYAVRYDENADFFDLGEEDDSCDFGSPTIITNPPFSQAGKFIRRSLELVKPFNGKVAMLLPVSWDAGKTRRDLFADGPFYKKYTLTRRIRWANLEQKEAGPSCNHAWFIWDWSWKFQPQLGWLP